LLIYPCSQFGRINPIKAVEYCECLVANFGISLAVYIPPRYRIGPYHQLKTLYQAVVCRALSVVQI